MGPTNIFLPTYQWKNNSSATTKSSENNARGPPRRLLPEVAEPNSRRGAEGLPVHEAGSDLLVARHGPNTVPVEPDGGAGLPQLLVERIGVGEKLAREGIDRRHGCRGHAALPHLAWIDHQGDYVPVRVAEAVSVEPRSQRVVPRSRRPSRDGMTGPPADSLPLVSRSHGPDDSPPLMRRTPR